MNDPGGGGGGTQCLDLPPQEEQDDDDTCTDDGGDHNLEPCKLLHRAGWRRPWRRVADRHYLQCRSHPHFRRPGRNSYGRRDRIGKYANADHSGAYHVIGNRSRPVRVWRNYRVWWSEHDDLGIDFRSPQRNHRKQRSQQHPTQCRRLLRRRNQLPTGRKRCPLLRTAVPGRLLCSPQPALVLGSSHLYLGVHSGAERE